jgi:hypothetical protein
MTASRLFHPLCAVLAAGIVTILAGAATPAAAKEPPVCAAISFRPIPAGAPDGDQDAGLYKSPHGKIEIKAEVQGGQAANYYMAINGKKTEAMTTAPKVAETCLAAKHIKTPFKSLPAGACVGSRFRVVIDRSGAKPIAVLFGLQGKEWSYCNASAF